MFFKKSFKRRYDLQMSTGSLLKSNGGSDTIPITIIENLDKPAEIIKINVGGRSARLNADLVSINTFFKLG